MFFRIYLIILLLSSSNAVWNPIYKEKILPEAIEIPPSNESPLPENISIYYSALLGSVFGVLITSGFFYGTKKYYKMSERDSRGDHEEGSTSLVEEPLKEVPHPSDQDSNDTESVHLITNAELVTPEDISIDLPLDSDPIEDDSQQKTVTETASEETSPVSLPTAKETETVSKSRSLPNSPRDASRLPKFNDGENIKVRSPSLARKQVKKETPSRLTDEHGSDHCGCKSKLALETLEKEVEDLRKSASNAERMKRDSVRALNITKKEMLASGSTIKEMGKEREKLKEEIEALKREKREAVRVANARWRQKLVHLQEAMKIDLSSELSKSDLSSGTKGSSSSKLDFSQRKTDFTCGRRGIAWDKARSASEKTRNKDSRTASRSTKIDSGKSSSPRNAQILPVFFKSSVEKGETKYERGCENNLVDESKEENKSGEIDMGRDDDEDVCKDVTKEEDQDDSRNIITKGNNDDDKNDNSHTAASDDVKDIKQDTNSSIADNKESISTESAMISETMTTQRCDLQEEQSKVELNGETNDLGVVESEETYGGKNFTLRDKSEAEFSDDFEFDFGEEELECYNSTELDYSRALSSQTFSLPIREINREDIERENDEPNETEIKTMNIFEVCEQNIPEVSKSDEADAVSKLESGKSNVDDNNGESEQPLSSSQGSEESPEVISPEVECAADVTDNVKRGAIPRPIAQQRHQRSMISKSHSVCEDNSKDVDNYVKSSTSAYISPGKSAAAVATALLRRKPPKPNTPPNKQRKTRNDSSLVKSLLTRPSTMGCKVGNRECSSFVKVTKNVCVVKTCGPDDQSSDNGEKTNEYTSNGVKSCLDSSCVMITEGKNTEQNVIGETNRKPLTEIFHSEDTFWVKFDGGSRNDFPPTPSNEVKQATEIENKPDPNHLEGKVSEKEENAEESLGGDIVQIPEAIANNTSEPMAIEETNDLEKCRNITKDAERCIQNIIDLGPSFTDEDKATLEYLLDRLNPVDDFLQIASFNSTLESVSTGMDNERKSSLNPPEKSNSERVNATQESERQLAAMRSVFECASENKDGESTKGLAEKLSRYFVYDPKRLAESFLVEIKEPLNKE